MHSLALVLLSVFPHIFPFCFSPFVHPTRPASLSIAPQLEVDYKSPGSTEVDRVYVCVVSKSFPERLLFSVQGSGRDKGHLLAELRGVCEGVGRGGNNTLALLQKALKRELPLLMDRFSRPEGLDKLAMVQAKAKVVSTALQAVLVKATERDALLEDIETESKHIKESAKEFSDTSVKIRSGACWNIWRVRVAVAVLILLILSGIAAYLTYHFGLW